ncbi:MAG: hypothetical protein Q4G69_04770, partial [Planctomycetia bacterium]|nr:hypothetical protein [Planctomycetia bacterium]
LRFPKNSRFAERPIRVHPCISVVSKRNLNEQTKNSRKTSNKIDLRFPKNSRSAERPIRGSPYSSVVSKRRIFSKIGGSENRITEKILKFIEILWGKGLFYSLKEIKY